MNAAKSAKPRSSKPAAGTVVLLVATRKGAFIYRSDKARRAWKVAGPMFFGHIVHHLVLDPRPNAKGGRTLLAATSTGHLGPTIHRSTDLGKSWKEASKPPAFPKAAKGQSGRAVNHTFWLTPGNRDEPGVWYAGTSPQGLFRTEDDGVTWASVAGFNDNPIVEEWTGGEKDGTPDARGTPVRSQKSIEAAVQSAATRRLNLLSDWMPRTEGKDRALPRPAAAGGRQRRPRADPRSGGPAHPGLRVRPAPQRVATTVTVCSPACDAGQARVRLAGRMRSL